jgi:topoisomerase-4 subunit A
VGPRGVSAEDVERLLKIPIRRISLYDINKARAEMKEIEARIKEIGRLLKDIVAYATAFLDGVIAKIKANEELGGGKRKTKVGRFEKIDVKEVVKRDLALRYDPATGYLGTAISTGSVVAEVSPFDRVLALRRNGTYSVMDLAEKVFVGKDAWWCGVADKEALANIVFTVIYREADTLFPCIKRCRIEGWIMNKDYAIAPDDAEILHIDVRDKFTVTIHYEPKPRVRVLKETFKAQDYLVKGLKAGGVRLASRKAVKFEVK